MTLQNRSCPECFEEFPNKLRLGQHHWDYWPNPGFLKEWHFARYPVMFIFEGNAVGVRECSRCHRQEFMPLRYRWNSPFPLNPEIIAEWWEWVGEWEALA